MKNNVWRGLGILFFMLLISDSIADEGKINGYFFGDYYYVAKYHDEAFEKLNGFQYRRVYLTYDKGLSDAFAVRFRLEMNSPSFPPKDKNERLAPYIKHGYLKWTQAKWRTNAFFGQSGTPTWETVETIWGYRAVEKTPLDLYKMGDSTDFGIAVQGSVDAAKKLNYNVMVGNGSNVSGETDKDKRAYLALTAKPIKGLTVEAYGDFEKREEKTKDNKIENKDRYTVQGFAAYQQDTFRVGAQFANQTRKQGEGKEDLNLAVFSAFGAAQVIKDKVWVLARFDKMLDANPEGDKIAYTPYDKTAASNTVIVGIDWRPLKDVQVIPNLFLTFYDKPEKGDKPGADIMPRLTLYYKF
jgi:hypothetical protein